MKGLFQWKQSNSTIIKTCKKESAFSLLETFLEIFLELYEKGKEKGLNENKRTRQKKVEIKGSGGEESKKTKEQDKGRLKIRRKG